MQLSCKLFKGCWGNLDRIGVWKLWLNLPCRSLGYARDDISRGKLIIRQTL